MFEQRLVANVADCLWKPWMATVHTLYHFSTCCVILASSKKKSKVIREVSKLKNVTKSGKSPPGGGQQKTSKSPKFEISTF